MGGTEGEGGWRGGVNGCMETLPAHSRQPGTAGHSPSHLDAALLLPPSLLPSSAPALPPPPCALKLVHSQTCAARECSSRGTNLHGWPGLTTEDRAWGTGQHTGVRAGPRRAGRVGTD